MHQIITYTSQYQNACMAIFDSNCPPYFLPEERQTYLDWLQSEEALSNRYFVLLIDDQAVASGGYYPRPNKKEVRLSWGMVHRDYHKKGIGSILTKFRLQAFVKEFPDWACSINTSQHTEAFYQRYGFVTKSVVLNGFGEGLHDHYMIYQP